MTKTEFENGELRQALREIYRELTTGHLVDRAYRAEQVTCKVMTQWEIDDEQGIPVRPPGR